MTLQAKRWNKDGKAYIIGSVTSTKLPKWQLRMKLYIKYPNLQFFKLID